MLVENVVLGIHGNLKKFTMFFMVITVTELESSFISSSTHIKVYVEFFNYACTPIFTGAPDTMQVSDCPLGIVPWRNLHI